MELPPGFVNSKLLLAEAFEQVRKADRLMKQCDMIKGNPFQWRDLQAQQRDLCQRAIALYIEATERFITCGKSASTDLEFKKFCREKAALMMNNIDAVKARSRLFLNPVDHMPQFDEEGLRLGRILWSTGPIQLKVGGTLYHKLLLRPGTYCVEFRNHDKYPGPSGLSATCEIFASSSPEQKQVFQNILPAGSSWAMPITLQESSVRPQLAVNVKTDAWIRSLLFEVSVAELDPLNYNKAPGIPVQSDSQPVTTPEDDPFGVFFDSLEQISRTAPCCSTPATSNPDTSVQPFRSEESEKVVHVIHRETSTTTEQPKKVSFSDPLVPNYSPSQEEEADLYALEATLQGLAISHDTLQPKTTMHQGGVSSSIAGSINIDPDTIDFGD